MKNFGLLRESPKFDTEIQSEEILLAKWSWQTCLTQDCHKSQVVKNVISAGTCKLCVLDQPKGVIAVFSGDPTCGLKILNIEHWPLPTNMVWQERKNEPTCLHWSTLTPQHWNEKTGGQWVETTFFLKSQSPLLHFPWLAYFLYIYSWSSFLFYSINLIYGLPRWLKWVCLHMQKTQVWSLGWDDRLEKGMATHSSIAAWEIPWTEEASRLKSMESQRVRHLIFTQKTLFCWFFL